MNKSFEYKIKFKLKKALIAFLAFVVPFTQIVSLPVAYAVNFFERAEAATAEAANMGSVTPAKAPNSPEELNDLVVLIIQSEIFSDIHSYVGLRNDYPGLSETSLRDRIVRYAEDIVDNNEMTDVKVVLFDKDKDEPHEVYAALENMYVNGDGTSDNKLAGVVFIGEISFPVINKNGNRFASVFPYTDFADSAYSYDPITKSFERNQEIEFPKAEIWHGVIKAPEDGTAGNEELAEFFDKNHLFYEGEPEFANFDKKIFFSDLIHEKERINKDVYQYYLRYLEGLEDLAYMRYNKFWAAALTNEASGSLEESLAESSVLTETGEEFLSMTDGGITASLPDIQSKSAIDQALLKYYQLLTKHIAEMNDWVQYTGRYFRDDVDHTPGLITMKDEYAMIYLKSVNDALEKQINELAEKMDEPLRILKYSEMSGSFGDGTVFEIKVGEDTTVNKLVMRYPFYNEVSGEYYMNGIPLDEIAGPKQCSVFLGSTKNYYFDENLNFDPKNSPLKTNTEEGEYSIMTRSIRSDNIMTAFPEPSIGVNTRTLSPAEAIDKTGGDYSQGAIVEGNPDYGIPAFLPNYLRTNDGFKNPFDGPLEEGDVIVEINDEPIGAKFTVDQAIEESFKDTKFRVNYRWDETLEEWVERDNSRQGINAKGTLTIDYVRNGSVGTVEKTYVVLKRKGESDVSLVVEGVSQSSDGAMFMLNNMRYNTDSSNHDYGYGYQDSGFGLSAGCFYGYANQNSDKCFYKVATMPILDPGGSTGLHNINGELKFPESFSDFDEHTGVLQYPDEYSYNEIDTVYLNSCYDGLPSIASGTNFSNDANRFAFPLDELSVPEGDAANFDEAAWEHMEEDYYGRLLDSIGRFVNLFTRTPEDHLGADPALSPIDEDTQGRGPLVGDMQKEIEGLDAKDVVLSDKEDGRPVVTLKYFSDRYGLFDGIDNNNDGLIDNYQDANGNICSDYCEANFDYGIDANKLSEINRKLLSKSATYYIPEELLPFVFIGSGGITLKVSPSTQKIVSSVILHNEPTAHTITKQLEAKGTEALPIDNPRYVAFQDSNGDVQKIYYPNLFEAPSMAQLQSNLSQLASQIALLPESYKVFPGAGPGDYTLLEIKNEILNNYLSPTINGAMDHPISGYDLEIADSEKILDALEWLNFGIDQKYEYVLQHYLNPLEPAYVNDSTTGYEASYIVMDGGGENIFTAFNKDLPDEMDPLFSDLGEDLEEEAEQAEGEGGEVEEGEGDNIDGDGVFIWEWIPEELMPFIEDLQNIGSFEEACVFSETGGGYEEAEGEGSEGEEEGEGSEEEEEEGGPRSSAPNSVEILTFTYFSVESVVLEEDEEVIPLPEQQIEEEEETEKVKKVKKEEETKEVVEDVEDKDLDEILEELIEVQEDIPEELIEEVMDMDEETFGEDIGPEDVGKIIILVSDPVKEVVLYSTVVETDEGEFEQINFEAWEVYFAITSYHEKFMEGNEPEGIDEGMDWEEHFVIEDYHEKFLINDFEGSAFLAYTSGLLASLWNDRPIAYIPADQNPFIDIEENLASKFISTPNDQMVADGKSLMHIKAQIYNSKGEIDREVSHKVNFRIRSDIKNPVTFERSINYKNSDSVQTNNGVAETYIKAGIVTGEVKVLAYLDDSTEPFAEKIVYLVAGEPTTLEMEPDSSILVANGQSKTNITFIARDKFGNLADNSFDQIALFSKEDIAELDPASDINPTVPGVQLRTDGGKASIDLLAKESLGEIKVIAAIMDYELEEEFIAAEDADDIDLSGYPTVSRSFQILDKVDLKLTPSESSLPANGSSKVYLKTELTHDDKVVTGYSGPVEYTILTDSLLGKVSDPPKKMVNGVLHEANVALKSKYNTGEAEILVDVPGFVSDTVKIDLVPGVAKKISLESDSDFIYTEGENTITLNAKLLDANGNLVESDNSTVINFSATAATKDLIEFQGADSAVALNGVASVIIKGSPRSGIANIIARAQKSGDEPKTKSTASRAIKAGTLSLEVVNRITKQEAAEFAPRSLYISLLGGSFGDLIESDNIAQTLLYSGQAQAVSSVTASSAESKRMLFVDSYGKIEAMDDFVTLEPVTSTASFPYQRVIVSDDFAGAELAEVFLVPKDGTRVNLIEDPAEEIPESEGIYFKNLLTEEEENKDEAQNFSFTKSGKKDIELFTAVQIDEYGRISINDDSYYLVVPSIEDQINEFAFYVMKDGSLAGLIIFKQDFVRDVEIIPYKSLRSNFAPGVYVRHKTPSSRYETIPAFTRSSTAENKGAYLVDTAMPLDDLQAPGFASTSLEDIVDTPGLGFTGENKHMLLFSAGNSVGESHTPYASEVGVIYGDPLIKLPADPVDISEITNHTKDIGSSIYTGDEPIHDLIKFDFNGDGHDDILLVYEGGMLKVLENNISKKHFYDRGYILNVVNGVKSVSKIDVNNDGYDDLLIGTKTGCHEDDTCVSLFTNNMGYFERETLDLAISGKILSMKVGDMNNDGCEDIVASDTSGNIRVFYNQVSDDQCVGLNTNYGYSKNFGFSIDSNENAVDNLFVYHDDIEKLDTIGYSNSDKFIQLNLPDDDPPARLSVQDLNEAENSPAYAYVEDFDEFEELANKSADIAEQGEELRTLIQTKAGVATKIVPDETYNKTFNFIHISEADSLDVNSEKISVDVNGGIVELGDEIEYVITLRNSGGSDLRDVMISDYIPPTLDLNEDSLKCLDSGCRDDLEWIDTGVSIRPKVIAGVSVPANGIRNIKYTTYVNNMPEVSFELGHDFTDYPSHNNDGYIDIRVRPSVNPDNLLLYLYSIAGNGFDLYEKDASSDVGLVMKEKFEDSGMPDPQKMIDLAKQLTSLDVDPTDLDALESAISGMSLPEDQEALMEELGMSAIYEDQELQEQMNDLYGSQNVDRDFDGLPDSWDNALFYPGAPTTMQSYIPYATTATACINSAYAGMINPDGNASDGSIGVSGEATVGGDAAEAAAENIENAMNMLRCMGAGCLPNPYNYAFFVPDWTIPGTAVFATGPGLGIPFVQAPSPTWAPSIFRLYVSPTLTAGLGTAICVGQFPFSVCWAAAVPVGALTGCDKIVQDLVDQAAALADEAMNDIESGTGGMVSTGDGTGEMPDEGGKNMNFFPDDSPVSVDANINIRIPGFPSVITNWIDKQTDEIYNKLLDLPDFYLILPDIIRLENWKLKEGQFITDIKTSFTNFELNQADVTGIGDVTQASFQGIHDFLRAVNSIPLIEIESKDVTMKLPTISKREYEKYVIQYTIFMEHMRQQVEKIKRYWTCDESSKNKTICESILLDMDELVESVQKFMDDLNELQNLPREILTWRNLEAKYAKQIICYMDAIMTFLGGYIKDQMKIIMLWINMIEEIIKVFMDWKLILDLVIDYKVTCDQCRNDRFSKLGLLMQLFVVLPEPPIIPLPKLPDFVFDFSKISTGTKIVWPDVEFKPEPIYLPDLPLINLPNIIPEIELEIPGFIVNFPDFEFNLELPDLPPLPIPELPDLPNPPKIPQLPDIIIQLALNLKPIFKILCLLKLALMPIPEAALETEIETLTQPNLAIIIPLLAKLAVNLPPIEYDFVKEVRATTKISMDIQTDFIYLAVKEILDVWNTQVVDLTKLINEHTNFDLQAMVDAWTEQFWNSVFGELDNLLGPCIELEANGDDDAELTVTECFNNAKEGAMEKCRENGSEAVCESEIGTYMKDKGYAKQVENLNLDIIDIDASIEEKSKESLDKDYSDYYEGETPPKEVTEALTAYAPFQELKENFEEMSNELNKFISEMEFYDGPDTYYWTAEERYIESSDPILNRPLADVERNIASLDLPDMPEMNRMAEMTNNMIAYVKNLEDSNSALMEEVNDFGNFSRILVENDESLDRIASLSGVSSVGKTVTVKSEFYGDRMTDYIKKMADETLIASIDQTEAYEQSTSGGEAVSTPKGFFVSDPASGETESVLRYTAEIGGNFHTLFIDADNDDDLDIVYSMGNDVFFKENQKNDPGYDKGDLLAISKNDSVDDYLVEGGVRIQGLESSYENYGSADVSWIPREGASAYEIILRYSLEDRYTNYAYRFVVDDPETNQLSMEIENGNYYATVFALDENGKRSIASESTIVAPQSCADKEPPFPVVDNIEVRAALFKSVEIDSSKSFDTNGEIKEYYLETIPYTNGDKEVTDLRKIIWSDMNLLQDSDGDGISVNDRDNPVFKIGPFTKDGDVGTHFFILHVVDQSGNSSMQSLSVEVFVPEISLDEAFSRSSTAIGGVDDPVSDMPFSLLRERFVYRVLDDQLNLIPRLEKVLTRSIGLGNKYYTDADGNYMIDDFNLNDMILVENGLKEIVAKIDPETGNIGALKSGYSVIVNEAKVPTEPTSLSIIDNNGMVLATVYFIANANLDVDIEQADTNLDDEFYFINFPTNDEFYPGGAALVNKAENKQAALIDTAGNIVILDSRISIRQKANNYDSDDMIIEFVFEGRVVGEIYIPALSEDELAIIVGPNDVPFATPRAPSAGSLYSTVEVDYEGVSSELDDVLDELYKSGVIDPGFSEADGVTRAEFVEILLNMLCIVPRPEAYEPFGPNEVGGGFSDININPYVKEGALLGIVEGYLGENDPITGLPPFKPNQIITLAEAVKMILESLEMLGQLDLGLVEADYRPNAPGWYWGFIEAGKNLSPYMEGLVVLKNNYIITPDEAENPDEGMTYGELIMMAERVLDTYNCFAIDDDNNGMSDYCEKKYGVTDPLSDEDNDELQNALECEYGADPTDKDTDDGGVMDGPEFYSGTDMLNALDDPIDTDGDGLTDAGEKILYGTDFTDPDTDDGGTWDGVEVLEDLTDPLEPSDDSYDNKFKQGEQGVYIVPSECNACPCPSTLLHEADVVMGDIFFSVISNYDESKIFSKSESVIIDNVSK